MKRFRTGGLTYLLTLVIYVQALLPISESARLEPVTLAGHHGHRDCNHAYPRPHEVCFMLIIFYILNIKLITQASLEFLKYFYLNIVCWMGLYEPLELESVESYLIYRNREFSRLSTRAVHSTLLTCTMLIISTKGSKCPVASLLKFITKFCKYTILHIPSVQSISITS